MISSSIQNGKTKPIISINFFFVDIFESMEFGEIYQENFFVVYRICEKKGLLINLEKSTRLGDTRQSVENSLNHFVLPFNYWNNEVFLQFNDVWMSK